MATRFWLLPLAIILISPMTIRVPFEMRVVDDQTGIGIPNLRVTTEDGNVCHTLGGGSCYWWRSSLMNRNVRFQIFDESNQFTSLNATLTIRHGGRTTVALHRRT
jgi:hypothetical protein